VLTYVNEDGKPVECCFFRFCQIQVTSLKSSRSSNWYWPY